MRKSSKFAGRRSPGTRKTEKSSSIISDEYKSYKMNKSKLNDSGLNDRDLDENWKHDSSVSQTDIILNRLKSNNNKIVDDAAFQSLSSI